MHCFIHKSHSSVGPSPTGHLSRHHLPSLEIKLWLLWSSSTFLHYRSSVTRTYVFQWEDWLANQPVIWDRFQKWIIKSIGATDIDPKSFSYAHWILLEYFTSAYMLIEFHRNISILPFIVSMHRPSWCCLEWNLELENTLFYLYILYRSCKCFTICSRPQVGVVVGQWVYGWLPTWSPLLGGHTFLQMTDTMAGQALEPYWWILQLR